MDDTSLCCTSGDSETTMHCSSASSGDGDTVDELSTTLSGQLKITSDVRRAPRERFCIDDDDDDDEEEEEEYFSEEDLLAQMGYAKADPSEAEEDEVLSEDSVLTQTGYQKNEAPKHEPINTPTAELNLVSAFKGSRDKDEGRPAEECRVSWAPDVYDPPCTSDDHFTESRTDRHKGASGKNRQKGGGKGEGEIEGRGGGGKGSRGGGSSKGNGGGSKAGGGSKEKRKAEKKHKKRGDSGTSSTSRYSGHGEY